jgi:hypothetical protein
MPGRPLAATESPAVPLTLNGIGQAMLGVSQLTPDGARCGLDLNLLANAARQPIADAGLDLREDVPTRVTVSAVTAQAPVDHCATAVLLGVYVRESFFSNAAAWLRSGNVVVWQRSVMVATPLSGHPAAVSGAVRRLVEQMLANWREQNGRGLAVASGSPPQASPIAEPKP